MNKEKLLQYVIEQRMIYHLDCAFKKYGLEKTEEVIKSVYKNMPIILNKYMQIYNTIINNKKQC